MATLPTDDDKLHMVLDIFKHFGIRPGEALMLNNITGVAADKDFRMEDVKRGLEVARERGLVENGPNNSIKLTDVGFAGGAGTLPTDDDKLRMALDIFKHFGIRPGEALLPNNIMSAAAAKHLRMEDVNRGLEVARERGFIEIGTNNVIKLTSPGFAAV